MKSNLYRVALVGAAGLKGRVLNEVLNQRNFPAAEVRLLDDDESLGQLEAAGDEASFIQKIRADQFEHVGFSFFASGEAVARSHLMMAKDAGSAVVDVPYA